MTEQDTSGDTSTDPSTDPDQAETPDPVPFDPADPPPPAMSQAAVRNRPDAPVRVWCPLGRHCLYAADTVPDGEDPAAAVHAAAGCAADPQACLCAHHVTPERATVEAVAVTPLTTAGAATMRTNQAHGRQLREAPDSSIVDGRGHPDTPLVADRAVIGLAGVGVGPVGPIGVDLLATMHVSAGDPEPEPDDGGG